MLMSFHNSGKIQLTFLEGIVKGMDKAMNQMDMRKVTRLVLFVRLFKIGSIA